MGGILKKGIYREEGGRIILRIVCM